VLLYFISYRHIDYVYGDVGWFTFSIFAVVCSNPSSLQTVLHCRVFLKVILYYKPNTCGVHCKTVIATLNHRFKAYGSDQAHSYGKPF